MDDSRWHFELTRPLCLAALALVPLLVVYWRRTLVRLPTAQQRLSLAVRMVLVVLVVAALAGPKLLRPTGREMIVAAVDRSPGISADTEPIVRPFLEAARGTTPLEPIEWARPATDLAGAISAARAAIPADRVGKIVLFSDGNATEGYALSAARAAGVPVFTVPLPGPEQEVYVSAVTAPEQVRQDEPFYLDVSVWSNHEDDGTVRLARGDELIEARRQHVAAGENRVRFPVVVAAGPAAMFTARLDGFKDTLAENNQGSCIVMVGPRPRVLLVEGQPLVGRNLAQALQAEKVEVEVRPAAELPAAAEGLGRYDLVILANVPAESLPAAQMAALRSYVRDAGGGLIAVGGERSFTAGGYRGTALEDVLPVVSEPRKEKPRPVLAMALVLDISGSMGEGPVGRRSIDLAKQALQRAVETLAPGDQVGVLVFEDNCRWIAPLGPATDRQKIIAQIGTIQAMGETSMYPPLERAYLALRETFADLKHIIVMTDGVSNPGDFDALAKKIAAAGITMSTVGVGGEPARPLLEGMANKARGRAYFCDDAAAVPKIFEMETISASRIGITEEAFRPQVVRAAQALEGLDFAAAPNLLGYVETQAKPGSRVVLGSRTGEPILAGWHYGLGSSAVFTSDITSHWAATWLGWPGFGRFWGQLARQTMRREEPKPTVLRVEPAAGTLRVTLDAVDRQGKFINGAQAELSLLDPQRKTRKLELAQVAPGRYAATAPAAAAGPYFLETTLRCQGQIIDHQRRGVVVPFPDELRIRPTNTELLKTIAQASGAQYDPKPADVLAPSGKTVQYSQWLWPHLLIAAMILLLIDLALKRVAWRPPDGADCRVGRAQRAPPSPVSTADRQGPAGGAAGGSMLLLLAAVLASTDGATAADLRSELRWHAVAPAAAVDAIPPAAAAGPSLEDLAAAAASKPPATLVAKPPTGAKPPMVVEGEGIPWAYRQIVRRYFELLPAPTPGPSPTSRPAK
ncbi:MAG: VWA domain-containing protein [Thermoguttaceae bacterium]